MNRPPRLFALALFLMLGAGPGGTLSAAGPPPGRPSLTFPLADLTGRLHALEQNDRRVRVFVFLSTECPIARAHTPTLNALADRLARDRSPVDFFGVVADPSVTRSEAAKHFADFAARFPVLFDASGLLAGVLRPTHVPEVFVVDRAGWLLYRGAIDDAWEAPGRRRLKAGRHFLSDAISAALADRPAPTGRTTPVGCLVEAAPEGGTTGKVTFTRDIAPVLNARCVNCHRDGQVAPFALSTYEQAARRAKQIVRVTGDRVMPPWIPGPGDHAFVGDRRLSDRELTLLRTWAETGRARGDLADLPPTPAFVEGWRLGKPDLILRMAEPFTVPAGGPDVLHNFVLPIDVPEDKLVAAIEFHPGNKAVAHHAVLFLDASGAGRRLDRAHPGPGYPGFGGPGFLPSGALGGWSVGNTPRFLPGGMGRHLKKGSDLVLQMHYHPTGKAEADQTEVGLYFLPRPVAEVIAEPARLVGSIWLANYEMDIPAGAKGYRRTTTYTLPRKVIMVGVVPHLHLLGQSMTVTARLPGAAAPRTLIDVPRWNYNWQDEYYFERPFELPAGTRLEVTATFDNSADNPLNPSRPPKRVTFGDGTEDEMLFCFFLLAAPRTEDLIHVIFDNLRHDARQPRLPVKRGPK